MNKQEMRFLAENIYKEDYETDNENFILSPREFNIIAEIFLAQVENKSGTIEFFSAGYIIVESENYEIWTDFRDGMTLEELGMWIILINELHNVQKTGLEVDLKYIN